MNWRYTHMRDPGARAVADRHYYRKSIGHPEIAPPGDRIALVLPHYRALWVSQRAYYERGISYRMDGKECWCCIIFRNESSRLASVLIRQALEATRYLWRFVPLPRDGFITYINEDAVTPPPAGRDYGWTWEAAGFESVGYTQQRHYRILQLSAARLAAIPPRPVKGLHGDQLPMFREDAA